MTIDYTELGPERLVDQGVGPHNVESAHRLIHALLTDDPVRDWCDLIAFYRHPNAGEPGPGAYEVWSRRGMVRFRRVAAPGGGLDFEVIEVVGRNPVENHDHHALRTLEEEKQAAAASGADPEDGNRRFIAAEHQSYPFGYERIAQLFDSPNAPTLALSSNDWTLGLQHGQHGALHVRQARAPLWLIGPGVKGGEHDLAVRSIDIAPTALAALGFPRIDGRDATGRTSSERGVPPDVLLARQDGRVVEEVLDASGRRPKHLYILLLDGLHPTALEELLRDRPELYPNIAGLRERAAVFGSGSIVNFPSITWPSHTAIGTGTWCGHHDVVNPSYYLRERREMVSPQGQQVETEGFSSGDVESLYEAFARVRGDGCVTAAIHAPFGRGADHAVLEGRNLGDKARLKALTAELRRDESPRWMDDGNEGAVRESMLDSRGMAQVIELFERDDLPSPDFVYHELIITDGVGHDYGPHSAGLGDALAESDKRIGRVLDLLEAHGRLEDTLFVLTADHGMAPQDKALAANSARHAKDLGFACAVDESMIWLFDLRVETERAADGRTGRVVVFENDRDATGERPAVSGARVRVTHERNGVVVEELATGTTLAGGAFGFATPATVPSSEIFVQISHEGFNPRRLTLSGGVQALDLRSRLYS
jgi:hypothetical protein